MFELRPLSTTAIPAALAKAERYRLLNEPSEAESICLDILAVDPAHQDALTMMLLAITDQFSGEGDAARAARAEKILARVDAGSVYWNCCDRVSPRLPWSGHGDSGLGLTLSRQGIQTFTRPKAWHLRQP